MIRGRIAKFLRRRGHGIHSPFVYSLVRTIYENRKAEHGGVCRELINIGLTPRIAFHLEQTILHCSYHNWGVDTISNLDELDMLICHTTKGEDLDRAVEMGVKSGATIAIILSKGESYDTSNHNSTVIEAKGYTLLFNNGLPKQRFKI
ncbi:MAG: hypothetical protein SNJ33_02665 [Rikenellaceae bacterium]